MMARGEVRPSDEADAQASIVDAGYWVVIWIRYLLAAHALLINAFRWRQAAHPWLLVAIMVVIVVWSIIVGQLQRRPDHRSLLAIRIDVAIAMAVVLSSPYVLGPVLRSDHLTAGVYWMFASAISLAVSRGFRAGLVSGLALGAAALLVAPTWYLPSVAEDLALPVASGTIGMMMDGLRKAITERDIQRARAAALAERDRLSRIVHDGTLQVLALVEREGRDLGPEGARLARLASTQEAALRSLLQDRTVDVGALHTSPTEITAMLERHQRAGLTVSTTSGDIVMDARRARELDLAVQELITNVAKHAGPDARAWLLVEQDRDEVVVWFRDDGVGMSEEQVVRAREAGHMGISGSVTGRLEAVGGSARVTSRAGRGVEWELRVPT